MAILQSTSCYASSYTGPDLASYTRALALARARSDNPFSRLLPLKISVPKASLADGKMGALVIVLLAQLPYLASLEMAPDFSGVGICGLTGSGSGAGPTWTPPGPANPGHRGRQTPSRHLSHHFPKHKTSGSIYPIAATKNTGVCRSRGHGDDVRNIPGWPDHSNQGTRPTGPPPTSCLCAVKYFVPLSRFPSV